MLTFRPILKYVFYLKLVNLCYADITHVFLNTLYSFIYYLFSFARFASRAMTSQIYEIQLKFFNCIELKLRSSLFF